MKSASVFDASRTPFSIRKSGCRPAAASIAFLSVTGSPRLGVYAVIGTRKTRNRAAKSQSDRGLKSPTLVAEGLRFPISW